MYYAGSDISRKLKTIELDVMTEDYGVKRSEVKLYGKGLKLKRLLEYLFSSI